MKMFGEQFVLCFDCRSLTLSCCFMSCHQYLLPAWLTCPTCHHLCWQLSWMWFTVLVTTLMYSAPLLSCSLQVCSGRVLSKCWLTLQFRHFYSFWVWMVLSIWSDVMCSSAALLTVVCREWERRCTCCCRTRIECCTQVRHNSGWLHCAPAEPNYSQQVPVGSYCWSCLCLSCEWCFAFDPIP